MHELSIAQSVVEIVEEESRKISTKPISEVELEIGLLSGVVPDALKFAMDEAIKNTVLENAKIIITTIPGKAKCNNCNLEFYINDLYGSCPNCSDFRFEVIQGKEMLIKNFSIE